MAKGVTKGPEDAPITIVEFGDFQCPACGAFAQQVKPQIELAFVESAQAKFVFYDFPIVSGHPNAFLAARAARCAEDQGLLGLVDLVHEDLDALLLTLPDLDDAVELLFGVSLALDDLSLQDIVIGGIDVFIERGLDLFDLEGGQVAVVDAFLE